MLANSIDMTRCVSGTRNIRMIVAAIAASVVFTACQSDSVTGSSYTECAGQPGCQAVAAAVAPEVMQSLDDASSRVISVLQPAARQSIEGHLAKLETALAQRDIEGGRVAFAAAISAIDQAERASRESAADLGAIRLGLVPAARSLGLPVSSVEAPTP